MFGHRYFGSRYFGPHYFGPRGDRTPVILLALEVEASAVTAFAILSSATTDLLTYSTMEETTRVTAAASVTEHERGATQPGTYSVLAGLH